MQRYAQLSFIALKKAGVGKLLGLEVCHCKWENTGYRESCVHLV